MTTIVYRDGVMAGDGRETTGDNPGEAYIIRDDCVKVYRLPDGRLYGAAHTSEDIARLHDALIESCTGDSPNKWPCPKLDAVIAMCISLDGTIRVYEGARWDVVAMPYYAVGSGSRNAFTALDAGFSAEEAVKLAMKRDLWSGGLVTVLALKP